MDQNRRDESRRKYWPVRLHADGTVSDEGRNRQDVRAYLTVLAKEHVELEVTMDSLRHEVEAKFPELAGRLGGFAALEDPPRVGPRPRTREAIRGMSGLDKLEAYKERRIRTSSKARAISRRSTPKPQWLRRFWLNL